MNLGNEQQISNIDNSTIYQINGPVNVTRGIQPDEVREICKEIVKSYLDTYAREAKIQADKSLSDLVNVLIEAILQKDIGLLSRFKEPSIQSIIHKSSVNYITHESAELKDAIIDLILQRLESKNDSSEQIVIEEAIDILHKVTRKGCALLTIFVFSKIIFGMRKTEYLECLSKLACLAGELSEINILDIEVLRQIGCYKDNYPSTMGQSLEDIYIANFDLFFRHPFRDSEFNRILNTNYSSWPSSDCLGPALSLVQPCTEISGYTEFAVAGSKGLKSSLKNKGMEYLLPLVDDLMALSTPYSKDEIIQLFLSIDKRWAAAFDALKKPQVAGLVLSPVGAYIGSRNISRYIGQTLPLSFLYGV